jgi:hypothetical protein
MWDFLVCLASSTTDVFIFPLFQTIFLITLVWARLFDRGLFGRNPGLSMVVKRGTESWDGFYLVYGVLAVVFVELNSTTESLKGHKTLITLLDLGGLLYLCFFSSWFRNKIVGIINASKAMEEHR